jgi:hypothetical protein
MQNGKASRPKFLGLVLSVSVSGDCNPTPGNKRLTRVDGRNKALTAAKSEQKQSKPDKSRQLQVSRATELTLGSVSFRREFG